MAGPILRTGAIGRVGNRLLRVLEEGGSTVRCLARTPWRFAGLGVRRVHAFVYAQWLRQTAKRVSPDAARRRPPVSTFTYESVIPASPGELFDWHEQPGALAALTPPSLVRIEKREGGIRDGGHVTVSIGVRSLRAHWVLRHDGYVAGRRFCDQQVHGPFVFWRHTHLFEPIGSSHTLYRDHIEFITTRHDALNRIAAVVLRCVLAVTFAGRHRTVRAAMTRPRRQTSRTAFRGDVLVT